MVKDKVWFVSMHTGYCGSDGHDILVMPEDATDEEVQNAAWEMAVEHASHYGYYPPNEFDGGCEDDYEDNGDGEESISDNIEGYAVPYDPELHDMYKAGGGSFMNDREYKRADL